MPTTLMPVTVTSIVPSTQRLLLCCPACGREARLQRADELPSGLARLIAPCPACEGHGNEESILVFVGGRVVRDMPMPYASMKRTRKHAMENAAGG